jgi:hypothetical protein
MSLFTGHPCDETTGIEAPADNNAAARQRLIAPTSGPDRIPVLCADIARLCDILRGERAYLALCGLYPSATPGAATRVREGQLREQNALFLLREARKEIVLELQTLIA